MINKPLQLLRQPIAAKQGCRQETEGRITSEGQQSHCQEPKFNKTMRDKSPRKPERLDFCRHPVAMPLGFAACREAQELRRLSADISVSPLPSACSYMGRWPQAVSQDGGQRQERVPRHGCPPALGVQHLHLLAKGREQNWSEKVKRHIVTLLEIYFLVNQ